MKPHKEGLSVYRAAKGFSLSMSILRYQNFGLLSLDVTVGFNSVFNRNEELKLVQNINTVHLLFCTNARVLCQDSVF